MNPRLDELRRAMGREAPGPLPLALKGPRSLLWTRADNLEAEQLPKLERALKLNAPLAPGWSVKAELGWRWAQASAAVMSRFRPQGCAQAQPTGGRPLRQMAKPLQGPRRGLWNDWGHAIHDGRMAGPNNKLQPRNRQAYRYRDEEFFLLKLLGWHESRYKLCG